MATLWSKGAKASDIVEDFTVGNDRILDMELAKYDVIGSKAHIRMLESIGLLTAGELDILTKALDEILGEIEAGKFVLEDDVEDIHSQVELLLTRRLGDVGKKIHSGRSRNDQVLVDIKLFLRDTLFCKTDICKPNGTLPVFCFYRKPHRVKGVAQRIKLAFKFSRVGCKRQAVFHILTQVISVCFPACLMNPILFLLTLAVEITVFQNR